MMTIITSRRHTSRIFTTNVSRRAPMTNTHFISRLVATHTQHININVTSKTSIGTRRFRFNQRIHTGRQLNTLLTRLHNRPTNRLMAQHGRTRRTTIPHHTFTSNMGIQITTRTFIISRCTTTQTSIRHTITNRHVLHASPNKRRGRINFRRFIVNGVRPMTMVLTDTS